MATIQLGDLLVRHGVMTMSQRDDVLKAQSIRGGPFGALAEEMFGISAAAVERAWAEQYSGLATRVDPRNVEPDPKALELINRRQAWQFCMLPIRLSGSELTAATSQEYLVRALKFAGWRLGHGVQFVMCDTFALGEALCRHYPMAGMTPESIASGNAVA